MRFGLFAGPIFIAVAIIMAGAGAAQAACADLVAAFDKAVAARAMDGAKHGVDDISDELSCDARVIEASRAKFVDSLIDFASTPGVAAIDPDKGQKCKRIAYVECALAAAENTLLSGSNWKGKARLADYYMKNGDRLRAHDWYMKSVAVLATPGFKATDEERRELKTKLAAAQSLANDDHGGQRSVSFIKSRDALGNLGGIYSPALLHVRGATVVSVPIPINFYYNDIRFTPNGEEAMKELAEAAAQVQMMTLVGHADPRGTHEYNMDLSRRRVMAVRDKLMEKGVKAQIMIKAEGDRQPFDVSVLPDAGKLSQEDIWQLDRRVEWVRDAVPE
jgi:outer membrane protein OmpA-like peptidoglycan-associated protein